MKCKWLLSSILIALVSSLVTADPAWAAPTVCQIFNGCTATSTAPAYGQILVGGKNGEYEYVASSTLGNGGSSAVTSVFGRTGAVTAQNGDYTTSQVTEGSNLYYTLLRWASALAGTTTDALAEGINHLYWTQGRFDTAFSGKSTSNLAEGSNLYFTNARAQNAISATYPITYSGGVIATAFSTSSSNTWGGTQTFTNAPVLGTLTGFIKAASGVLSTALINLASDVTGTLPVGNGGTASTTLTGILKGNGTSQVQTAVGDSDYQKPITLTTNGSSGAATFTADTLNIPQYTAGGGGTGNVATSSPEIKGQVPYWTSSSASPATLGTVPTTTLACSGPFSGCTSLGYLIGGSNSTITWTGLATTSQPSSSNLLVSNGAAGVYGVGTTSATISTGLSYSGTWGALVGGVAGTLTNTGVISLTNGTGVTCSGTNPGSCSLAAINANSVLANNTGASAIPTAIATSTGLGILHSVLGNLAWTSSGHTGTANRIPYFNSAGAAAEVASSSLNLGVSGGGTGLTSVTQGDLLYASAANTLTTLAKDTNSTRYLSNQGASNNPSWNQINLTNGVTGTLPYGNGGTGQTSYTTGNIVYAGATAFQSAATGTLSATDSPLTFSNSTRSLIGGAATVGLNLSNGNTWSALQQFSAGASTTQLSVFNKAYFGASATTTIDSTGNITLPSGSNLTITGKSDGCATFASGQLNSTGSACGSGGGGAWPFTPSTNFGLSDQSTSTPIADAAGFFASSTSQFVNENIWGLLTLKATSSALLATDASGNVVATSSIGFNLFTGMLPIANGGTNANSQTSNGVAYYDGSKLTSGSILTFDGSSAVRINAATASLNLGQDTLPANTAVQVSSSTNAFFQTLLHNKSSGAAASTDLIICNDRSTDCSAYYTDLGQDSSGWASQADFSYLYSSDSSLLLATASSTNPNAAIVFHTQGTDAASERARITNIGLLGIGTTTPNSILNVASSTGPQLSLSDTTAGSNAWTLRSISNSLFIATSTYTATSTVAALSINQNGQVTMPFVKSALVSAGAGGALAAYAGGTCTNQAVTVISATGAVTCSSITDAFFSGQLGVAHGGTGAASFTAGQVLYGNGSGAFGSVATGTLSATDSTLTFSDSTRSLIGGTATVDLNLANSNAWTALQKFTTGASSTQLSVFNKAYFGGTATSTFDSTGALTLATPLAIGSGGTGAGSFTTGKLVAYDGSTLVSSSTIGNNQLQNSTISGVALGGTLGALSHDATLSGTSYTGTAAVSDSGLTLTNSNIWTALQLFNGKASSTLFSSYGPAYFGGTATSSFSTSGALTLATPLTTANGGTGTTTWQTGSIPFYNGTNFTENNAQLLWDNTNNRLGVGSSSPAWTLSMKAAIPVIALQDTTAGGSTYLLRNGKQGLKQFDIYDVAAKKSMFEIQSDNSSSGMVLIGTSANNISGNNSRLFVFGGLNGANIDVMGDGTLAGGIGDQAQVEVEGSDYNNNGENVSSIAMRYFGPLDTVGTLLGYPEKRLGILDFGAASTSIISTGLNENNASSPLLFGTGYTQRMVLDGSGNLGISTTSPYALLSRC